ncbi:MAG: glycosyltransferase family 4 protein [Lentisphaeraceae bacterium]|nr:glycosyltransferase family 4 protein [Lentisphaeraceae bacterium]
MNGGKIGFKNPQVNLRDLKKKLLGSKWDAVWFHGYINKALLYGMWLCKCEKIPFFFRAESNLTCTSTGFVKDRLIKWIVNKAAALLWVSSDNKDYYKFYGADDNKLFFTPYAVDNDFFQSKACKKSHEKIIILYASKFIPRKNAPLLLEAYLEARKNKKQDSELWFVGDGEDRGKLKSILEKNARDDIKLLGFKNQTELPEIFSQCDVFVLPSNKEPFGLVINEIMNMGKAVISTNEVAAARDLIENEKNGWIVEAGSKSELTRVLQKVLSGEYDLQRMGERSIAKISTWSFKEDVQGIFNALESLSKK